MLADVMAMLPNKVGQENQRWESQPAVGGNWIGRNIAGAGTTGSAMNTPVVPTPGFELGTYRLQGGCSTN